MSKNYQNPLTVKDVADFVNLSESYFYKLYKASRQTPYSFLLKIRLEKAKEFLRLSNDSISEIAYKCGFNSDANFIYFFKRKVGISPLKFRKISF